MRKPCCDVKDMNKGAWSKQEDQKLMDYINKNGEVCWRTLPQAAGLLRCGKSCRLRWINYLRPDLKRGNFADDEEDLIVKLHALLGNRWSLIAGRLPGRTDNEVKNYWNSHLRRKLISRGIDPNNHRFISHKTLPLQNPPMSDSSNKSPPGFEDNISKNNTEPTKSHVDHYGQLSDEDESNSNINALPDLNLDLAISFPNSPPSPCSNFIAENHESESCMVELQYSSPSTLVLFR